MHALRDTSFEVMSIIIKPNQMFKLPFLHIIVMFVSSVTWSLSLEECDSTNCAICLVLFQWKNGSTTENHWRLLFGCAPNHVKPANKNVHAVQPHLIPNVKSHQMCNVCKWLAIFEWCMLLNSAISVNFSDVGWFFVWIYRWKSRVSLFSKKMLLKFCFIIYHYNIQYANDFA